MKYLYIIFYLVFSNILVLAQDSQQDPGFEIKIINYLNQSVYARLYPVSAIFNGRYNQNIPPKFTLNSFWQNGLPRNGPGIQLPLKYLVGFDNYALNNRGNEPSYFEIPSSGIYNPIWLDHNTSGTNYGVDALYGYGFYNLEIWVDVQQEPYLINGQPILLDYRDFNYPYNGAGGLINDLEIHVNATTNNGLTYLWHANGTQVNFNESLLPAEDRNNIKCYKQYHGYVNGNWEVKSATPNVGTYNHGITKSDELIFPIDGTEISDPDYQIPRHDNPGLLVSPLEVLNNHVVEIKCGNTFTIGNGAKLTLLSTNGGSNFAQVQVGNTSSTNCGASFTVKGKFDENTPYAWLYMYPNCTLTVNKKSTLVLE